MTAVADIFAVLDLFKLFFKSGHATAGSHFIFAGKKIVTSVSLFEQLTQHLLPEIYLKPPQISETSLVDY